MLLVLDVVGTVAVAKSTRLEEREGAKTGLVGAPLGPILTVFPGLPVGFPHSFGAEALLSVQLFSMALTRTVLGLIEAKCSAGHDTTSPDLSLFLVMTNNHFSLASRSQNPQILGFSCAIIHV